MSIKQAFVTGATGIVGVPLCRKLSELAVSVVAFSRTPTRVEFAPEIVHETGDILDRDSLARAAAECDVIFHVAAAVHGSANSHAEIASINVEGTKNVIEVARDLGAKLVHVSTVNVAGFKEGRLVDPYAETKSRAEDLVLKAADDGMKVIVVRPATVFGDEPGNAGMLVDRLLRGSLKILPAPSRMISPVWSCDLADALIAAVNAGESGRTYTVAGPPMSTGEFVDKICNSGGLRKPLFSVPALPFAALLQLAWWARGATRWTPPVTVESLLQGSVHGGSDAARELGFSYTSIEQIFGV